MVYTRTLTAPKAGSSSSPERYEMRVTYGLIYQFECYLPPGSAGLLHVKVTDGAYPLWPSELDEWFFGDNIVVSFPDRYFIQAPDHVLFVYYYNTDDTYDHSFQIRIGQASTKEFIASYLPGFGQASIEEVLLNMARAQEEAKAERQEHLIEYFEGGAFTAPEEEK